ncbi:hypothetical protein FHP24_09800 [Aliirhizobium smilacinae]|uniref:Uncharacterized protein n=1 Tax=Aliirhizobium smilacinae TaxID=1395944 RepID=A0A5C4XSX0_9HYPH|nr:hypothetical protein FHP24_09800 [Rhizobium smilacinae]
MSAFSQADALSLHGLDAGLRWEECAGKLSAMPRIEDVFADIAEKAAAGTLTFHAVNIATGEIEGIPRHAWSYLRLGLDDANVLIRSDSMSDQYRDIICDAMQLIGIWPAAAHQSDKPPTDRPDAGKEATRSKITRPAVSKASVCLWWLDEFLPKCSAQATVDTIWKAAKVALPDVSRSMVREVVEENYPSDWSKTTGPKGPRKTTS